MHVVFRLTKEAARPLTVGFQTKRLQLASVPKEWQQQPGNM